MKIAGVAAALVVLFAGGVGAAQSQDVANDVSRNIMSPYCPGVTLHDCPSAESRELFQRIQRWAEDGMTRSQIIDHLEEEFGPAVRATPPREGSGWLAWILPALAVLAGGALAWRLARRWTSRDGDGEAPVVEVSDDDRARLDVELERIRRGEGGR
jgi:cytochrome c-type biogenesis protein CcmH